MHFLGFLLKLFFISILAFLTHTFISQKIKNKNSIRKQNYYTNRRQIMKSSPSDFLQGHPQTPPCYLHFPSFRPPLPLLLLCNSLPLGFLLGLLLCFSLSLLSYALSLM